MRISDWSSDVCSSDLIAVLDLGYGATEAGPVIAVNTPMHFRAGSVGRLLPGIEARLDDVPGIEEGGRLSIRGPNIMAGYMKADAPGVLQPPEGGGHDTGATVTIDDQGFVRTAERRVGTECGGRCRY